LSAIVLVESETAKPLGADMLMEKVDELQPMS